MADRARPVILGIVGDSAVGKTTLSNGIAEILGPERVTVIRIDDYHRLDRAERAASEHTALDPAANHLDIMEQHLRLLREGRPILKPVYNHTTGTLDRPEYVVPTDFVIAEGLLGYRTGPLRSCYDVKVFLEPEEDLRVLWKIRRDTALRGYDREEVIEQLRARVHDRAAHVMPQRAFADIVIQFHRPPGVQDPTGPLDVRHSLRPTLPHPDFSPLLDDETSQDLRLGLARDFDSKPVDVLDIDGHISDERTRRVEELMWRLLPDERHERVGLGEYFDGTRMRVSNALALTQRLVAFHMIRARLDCDVT